MPDSIGRLTAGTRVGCLSSCRAGFPGVVGQNSIPAVEATKRSRSAAPIMAAIEVRPARGACHRLEDYRMSNRRAGSKPPRERRVRSDLLAGESRARRLPLRCAADAAVVESADLGQGNDASLLR